jgi:hypothetical protein
MSSCVNWAFFCTSGPNASETSVLKAHECQKRPNLHTNELNTTFFCSTSPLKAPKSIKIFKISLTFRFDKLWQLSKSVHTGENSQILTVSNTKQHCLICRIIYQNTFNNFFFTLTEFFFFNKGTIELFLIFKFQPLKPT